MEWMALSVQTKNFIAIVQLVPKLHLFSQMMG